MLAEDKLTLAEADYHEALDIAKQLGDKDLIEAGQLSLAAIALEKRDMAGAETIARAVGQEAHTLGNAEREMSARNLLARTLTMQGKLEAANTELKSAAALPARDETAKLNWSIAAGEFLLRQDKRTDARQVLTQALARATKMAYVPGQFEAQLALIDAESGFQDRNRKAREVRALAQHAADRRFYLLARKAKEMEQVAEEGTAAH